MSSIPFAKGWTYLRWLGLTRFELSVYVDNAPAIALYERCGFVREGTFTAYARRDGELVDSYAMARVVGR